MKIKDWIVFFIITSIFVDTSIAQTAMINIESRDLKSLNGNWSVIIDLTGIGEWRQVWLEKNLKRKLTFLCIHFKEHRY